MLSLLFYGSLSTECGEPSMITVWYTDDVATAFIGLYTAYLSTYCDTRHSSYIVLLLSLYLLCFIFFYRTLV